MIKHWTFRQFATAILLAAAIAIAVKDVSYRDRFYELVTFAVGGYFGQMTPQGKN